MSEKRFIWKCDDENCCIFDTKEKKAFFNVEVVDLLNEQQTTISALKDIFKDIITYSKWDSEKPYCSLGIAVDKKTYYKIREILNE